MPAEDSERSGFPAWMASGSVVCPCPLDIGWEMFVGSRDPNMLFHSSFTFESCFTCFLAISSLEGGRKGGRRWEEEKKKTPPNIIMTTFTQNCHYFETTWKSMFKCWIVIYVQRKPYCYVVEVSWQAFMRETKQSTCHVCSHLLNPTADSGNKSFH